MRPSSACRTCSAVVGDNWLDRFAGSGDRQLNQFQQGASNRMCRHAYGDRRRTAVTMSGTFDSLGNTSVSGPGQKCSASLSAMDGQSAATSETREASAIWTMIGLFAGRPLAAKIRATAVASSAFAPNP